MWYNLSGNISPCSYGITRYVSSSSQLITGLNQEVIFCSLVTCVIILYIYVFNEEGDISRVVLFRKIREMVSNKYDEQNKDMNKLMYGHVEVYVNKTTEITIVNKDKKIFVTYEPIKNTDNSSSKGENPF